ncbi:MAG: IS1595 family transposase [Acidithiobacillus ferrooxidans]|nr:IS1595 family transposase [Acidithiobacillus ferrooxidans]MDD5002717.1 IS1595 family transposase [Acidithiobacillus sp.]MDD5379000.1 IS1595 family transposase [Acidithiobacillus sp.]
MDERGFPTTLPEFQRVFPDEAACASYLESLRWPEGFVCAHCGLKDKPYRFGTRSSTVFRCRGCDKTTSLTAGTVMEKTRTPLSTWFWAAYLMTTQTPGMSALQFQRQLGMVRYATAHGLMHKLRAGMVRPDRDAIGGEYPVEIDECLIGGATRGKGRGVHDMTTVVGAVEVRARKDGADRAAKWKDTHANGIPLKKLVYAGRLRLRRVEGKDAESLTDFIKDDVALGSLIRTDGALSYKALPALGYRHDPLTLAGDPDKAEAHLPMIHLVFSNLKTWILGTHHGRIEPKHLQAYLNEYMFRFNRRFYPMTAFNSVLGLAARSASPTYAQLYSGEWVHPIGTQATAARNVRSLRPE